MTAFQQELGRVTICKDEQKKSSKENYYQRGLAPTFNSVFNPQYNQAGYAFGNMLRSKGIGIRNVGQIDKEKLFLVTYEMVLLITDPYIMFSFDDFL